MPQIRNRVTIRIFGLLIGTAEGPVAIAALVLIVLAVTKSLWWP
jgi:uncharacterized membrane protein required for colicin V production